MEEAQIVGIVIAYTQIFKQVMPEKSAPFVAIALGMLVTVLYDYANSKLSPLTVLKGLVIGAGATGAYSATEELIKK